MIRGRILWVDDEIELFRAHILFLEEREYKVTSINNGEDAVELVKKEKYDIVFLDEMMPGKGGLETLTEIKEINPGLPVVMITKSEEESLMEEAIGEKIKDFLIKPVNPSQILLALKRILDSKEIEGARISRNYSSEFMEISRRLFDGLDYEEWTQTWAKLCEWSVELDRFPDLGLEQTLRDQIKECNKEFNKYIEKNYMGWLSSSDRPVLSVDLVEKYLAPLLKRNKKVVFIVIDCLRLDQWIRLESYLYDYFNVTRDYYYSILPTATPFSRNAIFSGMFPLDIEKQLPDIWADGEDDETSRNKHESELLNRQLQKIGINIKPEPKYVKILDMEASRSTERNILSMSELPLTSLVYNFVDNLAHKRSESDILKEITPDESAYRKLTESWFEHSTLYNILKTLSKTDVTIILTTDHGSIRVHKGTKVLADRESSSNIRYKYGRNLKSNNKHVLRIKHPYDYKLPMRGINCDYVIAKNDYFLLFESKYHRYENLYKDSFQHGGISLEEIILPVVKLESK